MNDSPPSSPSPFYMLAETHAYSDWLFTYLTGEGVDDLREYYVGGFPDLSPFIDKKILSERVIFSEPAKLSLTKSSTPLRKIFKRLLPGRTFIDLGCGKPTFSVFPKFIAEYFHAACYLGIDLEVESAELKTRSGMNVRYVRNDLFHFLKNFNRDQFSGSLFFYLAGIEVRDEIPVDRQRAWIDELGKLLHHSTRAGDAVLVGAGTPDLDLTGWNFKLKYSDYYHFLFIKRRRGFLCRLFKK